MADARQSGDGNVLRLVHGAFNACERPEHFTDYRHCCECFEHDELLRSRDNETLRLEDVGNPGWDPLCYVDASGFAYFFPGLARLALEMPTADRDWYLPQLLFHLTYEDDSNRHLRGFTAGQRDAVLALLEHVAATRRTLVDEWDCADDLRRASGLWARHAAS